MKAYISIVTVLLFVPTLASAQPSPSRRISAADDRPSSGYNLPIGCNYTPQEILNAARQMRGVRTAIEAFQSRGYIAEPEGDQAVNGCRSYGVEASAVALTFRKPMFDPYLDDSTKYACPMILVSSCLNENREPVTTISGGFVIADAVERRFFTNEQLGILPNDPIIDVRSRSMGSCPTCRVPEGRASAESYVALSGASNFWKKLNRWAGCTGWSSFGCSVAMLTNPKSRFLFLTAQSAAGVLAGCMISSGISCLWIPED